MIWYEGYKYSPLMFLRGLSFIMDYSIIRPLLGCTLAIVSANTLFQTEVWQIVSSSFSLQIQVLVLKFKLRMFHLS